MQNKMHRLTQTLSFTQIPALCEAQTEVLGAGTFLPLVCHSGDKQVAPEPLKKSPEPLKNSFLPGDTWSNTRPLTAAALLWGQRRAAAHKRSHLQTKHACYIGVCLYACHGKTIMSASMKPVCLCGMTLQKRAHLIKDCWQLAGMSSDWNSWMS